MDKGSIHKLYKQLKIYMQPNIKKKKGSRPKQQTPKKTYRWPTKTWKDAQINIAHYWRNANQNYNEASPHVGQNGHHQKIYK